MKWYGEIGFGVPVETSPGVWEDEITTRKCYGDVLRSSRRLQPAADKVNDDVNISNSLSVVADPYTRQNIYAARYAEFAGAKWKITDIEVSYPRITLTLGGLYNGETQRGAPEDPGDDSGEQGSVLPAPSIDPYALSGYRL